MSLSDRYIINNTALMDEWDWEKNNALGLNPEKISEKSEKKPWWRCKECNNSWQTAVYIRSNGHGCPICSRKNATRTPKASKPFISTIPSLLEEWDWHKNGELGLFPDKITCGSNKKVWWICKDCGNSWNTKPLSRDNGSGCPICGRKKAKESYKAVRLTYNSLSNTRPDLLEEWDYELNGELTPDLVTASTNRKVWWRCKKCNQAWNATISHRAIGRGCPVCAGKVVVSGINDLATVNPRIAAEWDYENNELTPQQVTARNNIKAAWVCAVCGHQWKSCIATRNSGTGCPQCQKNHHTSLPEQIVYFYVKQAFPDTVNGFAIRSKGKPRSVDIYIPSLNLAIEYDGSRWHKNINRDLAKNKFLTEQGFQIIRLREKGCPILEDSSYCITVDYTSSSYLYLTSGIQSIFEYIKQQYGLTISVPVDIEADFFEILSAFETDKKEKSLAVVNPKLASEWDYNKNGAVTPNQVIAVSDKRFWWVCKECNYSWKAIVSDRHYGSGCPRCSGNVVWEGVNDLQTKRPEVAAEWDYEKNVGFSPNTVSYRGNRKAWWLCQKCGYSWSARVADRSAGIGCPACAGKAVMEGRTDLATVNPELALEWDYEKNGTLTPQMVVGGSNKKVWWKCKVCSHSWKTDVYSRHTAGHGCPVCGRKNRKITLNPDNILSKVFPEIALEWDYEKNGELLPDNITFGSGTKVFWLCKICGHSWQAAPNDRANGHGCPVCAIRKQSEEKHRRSVEKNNFYLWCQEHEKAYLLEEWDTIANNGRTPNDFSYGSNESVGWICNACGHKWSATISNRVRGSGCPNCYDLRRRGEKNTQPVKGNNAFPTWCLRNGRHDLLEEWNVEKNVHPAENYTYGSNVKLWWKCRSCGCEWETTIKSRILQGTSCPQCGKRKNRKKEQGA